jgi:hypothetical protein
MNRGRHAYNLSWWADPSVTDLPALAEVRAAYIRLVALYLEVVATRQLVRDRRSRIGCGVRELRRIEDRIVERMLHSTDILLADTDISAHERIDIALGSLEEALEKSREETSHVLIADSGPLAGYLHAVLAPLSLAPNLQTPTHPQKKGLVCTSRKT